MRTNSILKNGLKFLRHLNTKFYISVYKTNSNELSAVTKGLLNVSSCSSRHFHVHKRLFTSLSPNPCFKINRHYPVNPEVNVFSKLYTTGAEEGGNKFSEKGSVDPKEDDKSSAGQQNLTVFQRFKKTYKEHGKVLIGVHLVTSTIWFGSFFYLAVSGIDVVSILEKLGFSETILKPFKSSHAGEVAVAYLLYKLATPARYTVTLAGTNFTIKYLQRKGKIPKATERERLKDLVKDGRQEFREKRKELDSKIKKKTKSGNVQDQTE